MKRAALIAALSALVSQPAFAEDYVFKGDCARANILKSERTINTWLPYSKYRGISRVNFQNDNCGRDTLIVRDLVQTQRSTAQVVYSIVRTDLVYGTTTGCPTAIWSQNMVGTVTLTLREARTGDTCELYIWSEWRERSTTSDWTNNFDQRVTPINEVGFVTSYRHDLIEKYQTPQAFTAVP